MTIVEAIKAVLSDSPQGLSVEEIFDRIIARGLYSFKAAEPKHVVRSLIRRHCVGLNFPTASPVKYFKEVGESSYAIESLDGVRAERVQSAALSLPEDKLPEEAVAEAHKAHFVAVRNDLKQRILQAHPTFFEQLVIRLLIKMGYGGSDPERGIHTGGPGDAGIDGTIFEDKLGLERIHLQAKRYAVDRPVKRSEIQNFAGALNKVRKGVFISTSFFDKRAVAFANSHEKMIALIDGDMLCDLMIAHGVGIDVAQTYSIYRVDNDYFGSAE